MSERTFFDIEKNNRKWEEFTSKKPIPGRNHPDDEKLLAEAKECIGDYRLKESPDYKPPPHLRETTVKKYKQVLDARLRQYNLRHEFIQKVWDMRDEKYRITDYLTELRVRLGELNTDLPEVLHRYGPEIPEINIAEFPEERLKPRIRIPEEDIESVDTKVVQDFVQKPNRSQLEQQLLPQRGNFPKFIKDVFINPLSAKEIEQVILSEFDELLDFNEDMDTPMETDVRVRRLNRQVAHQEQAVLVMNRIIKEFNQRLDEAKKERLPIHVGGNFIDIYILTLNQELQILKNFEDGEDELTQKVLANLQLVHDLQDNIDMLKNKKQELESYIENLQVEEHKLQDKFKHAAENNKFYDFLRKVFRKKYKPPKVASDDDSSSESSSSSSEESDFDDSASIDSRDFGFIKQDLNVCPKGCELAIYNLTVALRSQRHAVEQNIRDQNRMLDTARKDIELGNRKMSILQNQLKNSQIELESYQREKQRLMNQVQCTVVLKVNQIHEYRIGEDEITDFLVVSKTILSKLYKRVGCLEQENYQQSSKYQLYHKHLTRLKNDLKHMNTKIKILKNTMKRMMREKFGKITSIDEITLAIIQKNFQKTYVNELEEIVLKKHVYDIRMKNTDIKQMYLAELIHWNTKISKAQDELTKTIKDNTKRLELINIMNKEKKHLVKILMLQPKRIEQIDKILESHSQHLKEIKKLEDIIEDQCKQLQDLKIEIKMLKTKGKKDEAEEEGKKEWIDYDKYIEAEEDVIPEKPVQEISMPSFYSTDTKDLLTDLFKEILKKASAQIDVGKIVNDIMGAISACVSVDAIVGEIMDRLPFDPNAQQKSLIDITAEKLYQIQEQEESDESFSRCAKELLEDIIDDVLLEKGEVHEVITNLVQKLFESLPVEYILKEESIESIVQKLSDTLVETELNKEDLVQAIERIPSVYKEEMLKIFDIILEKVFHTGIDFLYVLKHE
ncbi:hypothetical protein JTB14_020977 [Gonioctena quinquepunctata]|nr:hypothetical protein JTB14_020977 [Gonioctena quinquepunctata]